MPTVTGESRRIPHVYSSDEETHSSMKKTHKRADRCVLLIVLYFKLASVKEVSLNRYAHMIVSSTTTHEALFNSKLRFRMVLFFI